MYLQIVSFFFFPFWILSEVGLYFLWLFLFPFFKKVGYFDVLFQFPDIFTVLSEFLAQQKY